MTLTVAEIEAWSAGDVREVFHAATSRAQAAQDAADGIASLPALTTWGGAAAEAAKESLGRTHLDLTAHSEAALAVAAAARQAADNIEAVQQALKSLESDADDVGLQVNRVTNKIERKPHSNHGRRWQQQNMPPLQQRLDGIVAMANLVDRSLADAITMADGTTAAPGNAPAAPPAPLPPDVAALQRANDEAMLNAAARVSAAQDAVDKAAAEMYTHGPGTPEFEAAAAKLPGLKSELVAALAEAGAIPDFNSADPNSVGVGQQGVNFSYRLPDGRLAQVTSTKLKDGSVELLDSGASAVYTYKDGELVATRFLDEGRAIATVEPLFTAVTAPLGVGPLFKGGEAAYLGLRGLFAKESVEALAGSSADDIITRGGEIVATRAESATDNLAAGTLDDLANAGGHSQPVFDITTEHAQHLGFDHAQGRFIAREAETGLRIEQDLGVQLNRAQRGDSFDYFDPVSGRSYDAVGNFPSQYFDKQWPQLQKQITLHLNKADIVPVDVSRFTPGQQQMVQEFVKGLGNPRIIVIGTR